MELIVLGSSGTWPGPGGATSGYLIRADGFNLVLDMGSGTLSRLQDHVAIGDVGAVGISHAHPDHFVDIYSFFYACHYGKQADHKIPLFVPPGFWADCCSLVSSETVEAMEQTFLVTEVPHGGSFDAGPFRVQTRPMAHLGEALGFRVEHDGSILAYTGDTGPTDEIVAIARDADLLVAEATWQDDSDLLPFHLSARQAGEHAARAGTKALMLTHMWPSKDPELSRAQAAEAYGGTLILGRDGLVMEIGSR